tara:strand:+ start:4312 stop:4998 length:687 start_codon:yes stop_codon:yes gene_type:complete
MVERLTSDIKRKKIFETSRGNAGILKFAMEVAAHDKAAADVLAYFVEDDYLHQPKAPKLVEQGLEIADYVTLYDHPDKYMEGYYGGGEWSQVRKTEDSHWRYTASTCMTFAAKLSTIRQDIGYWSEFISGDHPHDHQVFTEGLVNRFPQEDAKLAVCIPGAAFHTDLTVPIETGCWIEEWALDFACKKAESKLAPLTAEDVSVLQGSTGMDRLKILAALSFNRKSRQR